MHMCTMYNLLNNMYTIPHSIIMYMLITFGHMNDHIIKLLLVIGICDRACHVHANYI